MNEFERLKELYERYKLLTSEDIGKLFEIIRILDRKNKWKQDEIKKLGKEIEDKKEEIYSIAKTNYILGQTDERSQWYKKINEKIEKIKKETWYISDGYEAKQSCIEELEELIGKEE